MDLTIAVNGVELRLGDPVRPDDLSKAGLGKVPRWKRLLRGQSGTDQWWRADDPRVICFDGSVEIYPCQHGYLDPDRRWGTGCLVATSNGRVDRVEIRVIDGKYAAGNIFGRFVDAGCQLLGEPESRFDGEAVWRPNGWHVDAIMEPDAVNVAFHLQVATD